MQPPLNITESWLECTSCLSPQLSVKRLVPALCGRYGMCIQDTEQALHFSGLMLVLPRPGNPSLFLSFSLLLLPSFPLLVRCFLSTFVSSLSFLLSLTRHGHGAEVVDESVRVGSIASSCPFVRIYRYNSRCCTYLTVQILRLRGDILTSNRTPLSRAIFLIIISIRPVLPTVCRWHGLRSTTQTKSSMRSLWCTLPMALLMNTSSWFRTRTLSEFLMALLAVSLTLGLSTLHLLPRTLTAGKGYAVLITTI
jgi:hypothetical protein